MNLKKTKWKFEKVMEKIKRKVEENSKDSESKL